MAIKPVSYRDTPDPLPWIESSGMSDPLYLALPNPDVYGYQDLGATRTLVYSLTSGSLIPLLANELVRSTSMLDETPSVITAAHDLV